MTLTSADIVKTARSFLGTPWRHLGRDRAGVDCVGLVVAVGDELGLKPKDFSLPVYGRQPDGKLLATFDLYMERRSLSDIVPGTVVIFSYYGSPYHAGIVTDMPSRAIVHAFAMQRKVVMDLLDNTAQGRKFVRAYTYRGVSYG